MSISTLPSECRFCSEVSRANGEDPIGSASYADHWLIMEIPQPWSPQLLAENPQTQPIFKLIRKLILNHGIKLKAIAIAPEREYSQPGYTRILYYHKTQQFFSEFTKQEYLVPTVESTRLAIAILHQIIQQPNELEAFERYRQSYSTRDILVCTHGNVDAACARFGFPIYKQLGRYAKNSSEDLRVWRCSHFGGHQYAPTLVDLPQGHYWGHLEPEILDTLIHRQGAVAELYKYYRGWAGVKKFEQIAEREIWMREGWNWLEFEKHGQIVQLGETASRGLLRKILQPIPAKRLQLWLARSQQDAHWAKVRLDFTAPHLGLSGYYEARVEISGQIMTAIRSDTNMQLVPVNQYQVTELNKVVLGKQAIKDS
ncbi:Sucraseferredoxin family protein (plasmid) [Gloeocapsa sp. PCC 7428]|uniref:sucrase ferredoxin n=1 Tax=Gloeocapsa sp. PCC 7428 TaxID=1173026 RepID=UPI0002A5FA2F|nr:sucrase ferredoxin [Gloeocapsa sp. PCC 7428]AFZ33416.1 Sucraseferredoxin family protein [Gloeocapsa sp. PCC 7428]